MINLLSSLTTKLAAFFVVFFSGKQHEKGKRLEEENKRIKSSIGISDSSIADKLRKRAANKRDRD